METVSFNLWAVRGYVKWLRDMRDQQAYDNATLGRSYDPANPTGGFAHGRIGGVAPFNPAQETDTAWGIAAWLVPAFVAEHYDDDRVRALFQRRWRPVWPVHSPAPTHHVCLASVQSVR